MHSAGGGGGGGGSRQGHTTSRVHITHTLNGHKIGDNVYRPTAMEKTADAAMEMHVLYYTCIILCVILLVLFMQS